MKINEVITESQQLDELSARDIARGIGTAVGKTAQGVGAVAGGVKGAWDAAKSGYQSGKAFVGGQRIGGGSAPAGGSAGAVRTVSYPQVVDAIPNMNPEELKNLKQKVDTALQQPQQAAQQTGSQEQPAASAPAQSAPAQTAAAPSAPSKPVKGQMATVNGKDYMFAGNMWVDERNSPAKGEDLTQIKDMFARGEIGPPPAERPAPRTPTPSRNDLEAANKPGAPAQKIRRGSEMGAGQQASAPAAPSQYGQLSGDEAAFVAAREREGLEPNQIQTALANRRARRTKPAAPAPAGQKTYAAPEKSQAKRTTDYKFYPKGGVNPSTKLSDIGPVGAAAKKTAANEGFYSKFLGKDI